MTCRYTNRCDYFIFYLCAVLRRRILNVFKHHLNHRICHCIALLTIPTSNVQNWASQIENNFNWETRVAREARALGALWQPACTARVCSALFKKMFPVCLHFGDVLNLYSIFPLFFGKLPWKNYFVFLCTNFAPFNAMFQLSLEKLRKKLFVSHSSGRIYLLKMRSVERSQNHAKISYLIWLQPAKLMH